MDETPHESSLKETTDFTWYENLKFDNKGHLTIPKPYRSGFGSTVYILLRTRDPIWMLLFRSEEAVKKYAETQKIPEEYFFPNKTQENIDKENRILLGTDFKNSEVTMFGVGSYLDVRPRGSDIYALPENRPVTGATSRDVRKKINQTVIPLYDDNKKRKKKS